jgi:RIO kinase 1
LKALQAPSSSSSGGAAGGSTKKRLPALSIGASGGGGTSGSQAVANSIRAMEQDSLSGKTREVDKADRATVDQVLDPRTRLILFKIVSRGILDEVGGCISTGKEANVYHGAGPGGLQCAVKVYKTSILVFKDRDQYVSGDFRFRKGYAKHNPRKMVRTWAEKEFRNLNRLYEAGVTCPRPILLREHVMVMELVGVGEEAAPKLKDAVLSEERARECYVDCVRMMRVIFQVCKLVHADLSEYNILYMKGKLWIIDVGQAVEHDHPNAMDFLRKDCTNVNAFFGRCGLAPMSTRELFEFVTNTGITDVDAALDAIMAAVASRSSGMTNAEKVDDEVFKRAFLPKTLNEVANMERDTEIAGEALSKGVKTDLLYGGLTGLDAVGGKEAKPASKQKKDTAAAADNEKPAVVLPTRKRLAVVPAPARLKNKQSASASASSSSSSASSSANTSSSSSLMDREVPVDETSEQKRERKRLTKEINKERRARKAKAKAEQRKAKSKQRPQPSKVKGGGGGGKK